MRNSLIVSVLMVLFALARTSWAGKPSIFLTQAGGGGNGERYLINGTWQPFTIANRDVEKWKGILTEMKGVGCEVVILDMTNLGQVRIMENALRAREYLDGMKFANFVSSFSHAKKTGKTFIELANNQAKDTWEMMAQDPDVYEYWGDKPLLIIWGSFNAFDRLYEEAPPEHKTHLHLFELGFAEAANNNTVNLFDRDSFGYRTVSGNAKVRQCAPCFGFGTRAWKRKTKDEYRKDCQWVKQATDYSVYGSWTFSDNMMMGITQTVDINSEVNVYPDSSNPFYYASVLRSVLKEDPTDSTAKTASDEPGEGADGSFRNNPEQSLIILEHSSSRYLAMNSAGNASFALATDTTTSKERALDSQWIQIPVNETWFYLEHRTSGARLYHHSGEAVHSIPTGALPGAKNLQGRSQWRFLMTGNGWHQLQNKRNRMVLSGNPSDGGLKMVNPADASEATRWRMASP